MSQIITIPSQVGGLNTRDSYDAMPVSDCIEIKNIYPKGTYCESREGTTTVWGSTPARSLIEYHGATPELLIANSSSVFLYSAVPTSGNELKTGFSSDEWNHFYYKQRTFIMNGIDTPQVYDGSTLADWGFTGVDPSEKITNGFVSKERCWFTYKNTTTGETGAYYGGIGLIAGALSKLSLNFKRGGQCVGGSNWSQDSGSGIDDLTVFFGSNGDVKVYTGNNFPPDTDDLFRVIEQFSIPKPIGYKFVENIGGDLIVLTQGGYINLSAFLSPDKANAVPISDKMNRYITDQKAYFNNYGWEIKYHKKMGAVWVVTPKKECHVMNLVDKTPTGEKAWTIFDINAQTIAEVGDTLYIGKTSGVVEYGGNNGDDGLAINCESIQASTDFGVPNAKQFLGIKPIYEGNGTTDYQIKCLVDFYPQVRYYTSSLNSIEGTPWNTAPWNSFPWYYGVRVNSQPRIIKALIGRRIGLGIRFETKAKVKILSNDVLFEVGNIWK